MSDKETCATCLKVALFPVTCAIRNGTYCVDCTKDGRCDDCQGKDVDDQYAGIKDTLRARGIQLNVGGCGCCGSPWVVLEIDGEIVLNEDGFGLTMFEGDVE